MPLVDGDLADDQSGTGADTIVQQFQQIGACQLRQATYEAVGLPRLPSARQ